jgi:hypothetical protein
MLQKQSFTPLSDLAPSTHRTLEQNKNIAKGGITEERSKRSQKSRRLHAFFLFRFFSCRLPAFFRESRGTLLFERDSLNCRA